MNKNNKIKALKDNIINYPYANLSYRKDDLNELLDLTLKKQREEFLRFLEKIDGFYGEKDELIDLHYLLQKKIREIKNEICCNM